MATNSNMKLSLNTTSGINGADYKNVSGFQNIMQNVMFYEKTLLQALSLTEPGKWNKYMKHMQIPMHIGDGINVHRYLGLQADPSKLELTKEGYDAPAPKSIAGVAVTAVLKWYGNVLGANDYTQVTQLDDLMPIYLPLMAQNAHEVMDNIAAAETVKGASKVYIGPTVAATGKAIPWTKTYISDKTKAASDAFGSLDINTIRKIISKFKNNVETYHGVVGTDTPGANPPDGGRWGDDPLAKGTVTTKAPIKPILGGNYVVLCSESAKSDLLNDPIYRSDFIRGISAQTLLSNTVPTMFGFTVEVVENKITAKTGAATGATTDFPTIDMNWGGDLDVSLVIGQEYAMDVTLAGHGIQIKQKPLDQIEIGDPLGRVAFIGYKLIYTAKVLNTMAVYALFTKPGLQIAKGDIIKPATTDIEPQK